MERYFTTTDLLDAHHVAMLLEVHGLYDQEDRPTRGSLAVRSSEPDGTRASLVERIKRLGLRFLRLRQRTMAVR